MREASNFVKVLLNVKSREVPESLNVSLKIMISDRDRAFSNNEHAKFLRPREADINHTMFLQYSYLHKAAFLMMQLSCGVLLIRLAVVIKVWQIFFL